MAGARGASQAAVKATSVLVDQVWRPQRGVVALLYHRVGARTPTAVDLPTALFDDQMAWLASRGLPVSIDDALAALAGPAPADPLSADHATPEAGTADPGPADPGPADPGPADPGPVVVTFDDGTADMVDVVLPILCHHGVPAVFYLATDFIEHSRPFPNDGVPLSWAAVREAVSTGLVTIGSHTDTHALLDRIEPAAAAAELDRSRELIEERVGVSPLDFAYPKAVVGTPDVEALVRARFRSAALGGCRPNPYGRTDVHRLSRSAIQVSDGMRYFERKARGGMALEDRLRRVVNRRRYSNAVT